MFGSYNRLRRHSEVHLEGQTTVLWLKQVNKQLSKKKKKKVIIVDFYS